MFDMIRKLLPYDTFDQQQQERDDRLETLDQALDPLVHHIYLTTVVQGQRFALVREGLDFFLLAEDHKIPFTLETSAEFRCAICQTLIGNHKVRIPLGPAHMACALAWFPHEGIPNDPCKHCKGVGIIENRKEGYLLSIDYCPICDGSGEGLLQP